MTNFDFARALGKTGAAALNADIEKQAAAGRVHPILIEVGALHGLEVPAFKEDRQAGKIKGFDTFSRELLTKDKAKGLPVAIGRALAMSCAAVRDIMKLAPLPLAEWITPKAAARKAPGVKAPELAAILAAINAGLYDVATLDAIAAAIAAAPVAAAPVAALL
jgi:hypothetical protein